MQTMQTMQAMQDMPFHTVRLPDLLIIAISFSLGRLFV